MAETRDGDVGLPDGAAETPVPTRPVVVVGAGVIGAACASALAEAGCQVLLIDRAKFGRGCSEGNCGYVSPSHVLPLCRPGAVWRGLKSIFERDAPFQVRLRADLRTWQWFWRFSRHCREDWMWEAAQARHALLQSSRSLYDQLIAHCELTEIEWQTIGLLFVYGSSQHCDDYAEINRQLTERFNVSAKQLTGGELRALEPALNDRAAGAWMYECDAHLRPEKLMRAWGRRLVEQGVAIREDTELIGIEHGDSEASAIITTVGRIEVDQIVIAAGAWTRALRRHLAIPVPIEPGKGYSLTCDVPEDGPRYPIILEDERVALTPMHSGLRIGSTMEFAGFDRSLRQERLDLLTRGANKYLRHPVRGPFTKRWYGWRPMSADGVPLIGRVPGIHNVWLASGHSMLGVSMAPGTGRLIAEMVTGLTPHIDAHPYRVDRF